MGSSQEPLDSKKAEQAEFDAAAIARKNELTLAQAYADQWVAAHKSVGDEARLTAVEGKRALEDLADALSVIDATESVEELEKLRCTCSKPTKKAELASRNLSRARAL